MIVNSHAHFFTFRNLNTRRARETLINRLTKGQWPKMLVDVVAKVFDKLLEDENLEEDKLLRQLVKMLRVDKEFRKLLDQVVDAIPGEVSLVLHGDLDAVAAGLLRRALARLFEKLGETNDLGRGDIEDVLAFLYIGLQRRMEDVAEIYFRRTPEDAGAVALMMDITKAGEKDGPRFEAQTRETSALALAHPGRVFPFYAVNPVRPNPLARLRRAVEEMGFLGVKLYPSLGHDPMRSEMKDVYAYCEEQDLPLLMHCNQGGFYFTELDIKFADPGAWRELLRQRPGLRICFGHFGGDDGLAGSDGIEGVRGWTRTILDLMEEFPGVYADVSYHVEAMKGDDARERYFRNLVALVDAPEYRERILWGSDFPLVQLRAREDHYWEHFQLGLGSDRFGRMAGENAARFLGLPDASGRGAGRNVLRHVEFLAANKYSVKRMPEVWVDQVLRGTFHREVDFVVNPFGVEWTTHNRGHIVALKALLVSRFPKDEWQHSFLDFGRMAIREIPNWPPEVESDRNRDDTFDKFAMELDATLRRSVSKNGPGAVYEQDVHRDDALTALSKKFRDGSAPLASFGVLIDSLYLFPDETHLG